MFLYQYVNPKDADSGWYYASTDDISSIIGVNAEGGDFRYFVAIDAIPKYMNMSLKDAQTKTINEINNQVGQWRSQFITVIPGQESTYLLKEAEADAAKVLLSNGQTPTADVCPILCAEASATNMSMSDMVNLVLTTATQWKQLAAIAEGVRRGAIVSIEAATTIEQVAAVKIQFPIIPS